MKMKNPFFNQPSNEVGGDFEEESLTLVIRKG